MKSTKDQMWCYLWEDLTDIQSGLEECKFGERFVHAGQDPVVECRRRIRESLGVRKDAWDTGRIRVVSLWNVSDIAHQVNRNRSHGKMDDWLRYQIGYRKANTGEVHTLSGDDMAIKVNTLLAKLSQPLPVAHLSKPQAVELLAAKSHFDHGHKVVLAELCARFGKTIWSGALSVERQTPLTIIATYVQTVTTSFMKDLTGFSQWSNHVHVDTKENDYQEKINTALRDKKPVVVYLSVCAGSLRQERVQFLADKKLDKLLVVDEADFGAHCEKQVDALEPFRVDKHTQVLLMTGTNSDRASKLWAPTAAVSVVYPELLVAKKQTNKASVDKCDQLKYFHIDTGRHALYAEVKLYQADLRSVVEFAKLKDPDLFEGQTDSLPSWSKFAANPIKAKGFFVTMLESMFLGKNSLDQVNTDFQFDLTDSRVRMMFLPGSIKNTNMNHAVKIAEQALPQWEIVPIYGGATTNRKAEQKTKEAIDRANGKNVLILSAGMASRSYSISEIEEVYLAYDSGDIGATIQKMSRALTPNGNNKIGRIISLSFDPNRDDKFDAVLLETAKNLQQKSNTDITACLRQVFQSVDLFRFSHNGALSVREDQYLNDILDVRRLSRVIGASADLCGVSKDMLRQIVKGNAAYFRLARKQIAEKGKTHLPSEKVNRHQRGEKDTTITDLAKAREVITSLVEHVDIIVLGTDSQTISEALTKIETDTSVHPVIEQEFGLSFELIAYLFESGIINENLANLRILKEYQQ